MKQVQCEGVVDELILQMSILKAIIQEKGSTAELSQVFTFYGSGPACDQIPRSTAGIQSTPITLELRL